MLPLRRSSLFLHCGMVAFLGALLACGDPPSSGMLELVEDPDVEQGCTTSAPAEGEVRVKRVECAEEMASGLLAVGRVGDFVLENSRIRVIVRGPGEGFRLVGTSGGGIVDAARHGREDGLLEIQPVVGWGFGGFEEMVIVAAGRDGHGELVVRGPAIAVPLIESLIGPGIPNVIVEHRYVLRPDTSVVEMTTRTFSIPGESGATSEPLRDIAFLGGVAVPFMSGGGAVGLSGARGPVFATDGGQTSYGWIYPDALATAVEIQGILLVSSSEVTPDDPGGVFRVLVIGDGSVSSVTDDGFAIAGLDSAPVGGASTPGVTVAIDRDDIPTSRTRADSDGRFELRLPPGDYTAHVDEPGYAPLPAVLFTVGLDSPPDIAVLAGPSGRLAVFATDVSGQPVPARVTITGAEDAEDSVVAFADKDGTLQMRLKPGFYDLSVSRGTEFSAFQAANVEVVEGTEVRVDAQVERLVDTDGWIAVDTHLHSEMSPDSTIPLADRIRAVVAEGIEVAIATDHDFVTDYTPYVTALGLDGWLVTQVGEESSSIIVGHINAWPLDVDADRAAFGAVDWAGRSPGEIFARLRARGTAPIIQVNHPRRNSSATFNAIELDPLTLMATRDPAELGMAGADLGDFSFDAIEVANAKAGSSFDQVFGDWLAFLRAGQPVTATGASDSHGASAFAGRSRTYVWVGAGNDDPIAVDMELLNDALRAQHVTVSQGAFVTASVTHPTTLAESGAGDVAEMIGQTSVDIDIRVQAANWMSVSNLQVYDHTGVVYDVALDSQSVAQDRFNASVTLPLTAGVDTFFVVRVEATGDGDPVIPNPGVSFTNPIYVDMTGDGMYAP